MAEINKNLLGCRTSSEETKFFKKVIVQNDEDKFEYLFTETNLSALREDIVDKPAGKRDYSKINFSILYELSKKYWRQSEKSNIDLLESLVYGFANATKNASYKYWVEKTPLNENYLNVIQQYWDRPKAILVMRDPRQTYCSHREYQHLRKRPAKIRIADFVVRWKESINNFNVFTNNGGDGLIIRYEDLLHNCEIVMKKIARFIGIPFKKCLILPTRAGAPWLGNSSQKGTVFNQVSPRSNNYLDKLNMEEIQYIEKHLFELMYKNKYIPHFDKAKAWSFRSIYYDIQPRKDSVIRFIRVKTPQLIKKAVLLN